MTQTDKMLARKDGSVGHLIFNNPERRNAVSLEMWQAAADILDDFAKDEAIRVVVLSGAGGKAFVSGADISKFEDERSNDEAIARYNAAVERANATVYEFPKPTIAMIQGYCIGGGLGLALCCDLRICSQDSRFAVPAAKLGLGYAYPGLKRMVDVVGPSFAKEIFYTARQFDAAEAAAMGLVNRVLPAADLDGFVRDYADTIGNNAPLTIAAVKFIVNETVKDADKRDLVAVCRHGQALLRQPGLHRGPPRLHGKAQAGVFGEVTGTSPRVRGEGEEAQAGKREARTLASVELRDLTKTYGAIAVVDRVSLKIEHGLLVCLLGPSGCGKTTTLRLIAGFVEPIGRRDRRSATASCRRRRARCRRKTATCR